MKKVADLYRAKAASPVEMSMLEDGRVGFMIPDYQRPYDWSEKNILRLHCDTLNGFERLTQSSGANAYTFLGTIILVEETTKEEDFSGVSYAIVDGQQRVTTLTLFECALCEAIRRRIEHIDDLGLKPKLVDWLKSEAEDRLMTLYGCAIGSQKVSPTKSFPFPRIVRNGDIRAKSVSKSYFGSEIGKFLDGFSKYFENETIEYIPPSLGKSVAASKIAENYQIVRGLVNKINDLGWYEDTECEQFAIECVRFSQCRNLFDRLNDFFKEDSDRNKAIESIIKNEKLHDLIRVLLFSAYFCKCIVLTRVITDDESSAFDIFDALNTTGEPLTAIETLKPRVINFEQKIAGYIGSESNQAFDKIQENLDERFKKTEDKQQETKELIITFALYLEGKKEQKELSAQRNFLRTSYDSATRKGTTAARSYIASLANISEFRRYYWERKSIEELGRFHSAGEVDEIQLLISFLKDMKTSLALPIIARYWNPDVKNGNEQQFLEAIRSIVAFIVIRRAATGGTAGIDSDFRAIMSPPVGRGAIRKFGLCIGADHANELLSIDELKYALRKLLEYKLKTLKKDSWIQKVIANPLYQQSKELVKFILLSSAHKSLPSTSETGTWERKGVRVGKDEYNFLNYRTWIGTSYATVEHVAPESIQKDGWGEIYKDNILKHTLGNLTLLPSLENSAAGDDSWRKKKKFYMAITAKSENEQTLKINEAEAAGIPFSSKTVGILKNGDRLSLLDPIAKVENWNVELINQRATNAASLCWDIVWPWIE